jgi:ATP-dependent Lon protease
MVQPNSGNCNVSSKPTKSDSADTVRLAISDDIAQTGAAADSADSDERLRGLPRLLRYAVLMIQHASHIQKRLIAEIDQVVPRLPQVMAWATMIDAADGLLLAKELDRRAVAHDEPNLRSLADCVRLLCLPTPRDQTYFNEHRRVAKALIHAFHKLERSEDTHKSLWSDLEQFTYGWAALPASTDQLRRDLPAALNAIVLGERMAQHRISAAEQAVKKQAESDWEQNKKEEVVNNSANAGEQNSVAQSGSTSEHRLIVAKLSEDQIKNGKLKDLLGPLKAAINTALPLIEVGSLSKVRNILLFEFPYASDAIDFALLDLVGRVTVRLRPLLLVGEPGGGKSRFARRLGEELLGVAGIWRTDASRADGASFGGTDRRWYTAEACHPFLAIARAGIANPLVLLDEIEKAATRADYGRLWDCLLGFLEGETNVRYPDPALQTNLDLSQVSYVATANTLDPLPPAIRDRFRIIEFPTPSADDLDALLPPVLAEIARERGLDRNWVPPLDGSEYAAVRKYWHGGSVRRLRRIIEAILRERDLRSARN